MTSFARDAKEGTSGVEIYLALFIGGAMTGPLGETVPAKRMRRAFVGPASWLEWCGFCLRQPADQIRLSAVASAKAGGGEGDRGSSLMPHDASRRGSVNSRTPINSTPIASPAAS